MTFDPKKNFAETEIAVAPDPADTGVSLSVTGGDGAKFPNPSGDGEFNVTVFPSGEQPTLGNAEILRVTDRDGDDLTVERGQENTTPKEIEVGWLLHLGTTAKLFFDIESSIENVGTGHDHDGENSKLVDHADLVGAGTTSHTDLDTHVGATSAHGVSGDVVGTSDTQELSSKTLTSPLLKGTWDSWVSANETWTYNAADEINVPSGAASKYQIGDKIKITQTTVKYFRVKDVADTLLTVWGLGLYTVASAAITSPFYSKASNPQGWVFGNYPSFAAYLSANQALTKNAYNRINFNVEEFDYGGVYDNATNYRFTAPLPGNYHFDLAVYVAALAIGDIGTWGFFKNGDLFKTVNTLSTSIVCDISGVGGVDMGLVAGDTVDVRVIPYSANNKNAYGGQTYTWFTGHLVGTV